MTRRALLVAALTLAAVVSPTLSATPAHALPYGGQAEFIGTGTGTCGSSCWMSATSVFCAYTGFNTAGPTFADVGASTATITAFMPMCIGGNGLLTLTAPGLTLSIPLILAGGPTGMAFTGTGSIPNGSVLAEGSFAPACALPSSSPVVFAGSVQWLGN